TRSPPPPSSRPGRRSRWRPRRQRTRSARRASASPGRSARPRAANTRGWRARTTPGLCKRGVGRARAVRREARGHAGERRERVARDPGGEGVKISITVNGTEQDADVEPRTLLVYCLREHLGLKGTNVGCDTTSCGACTVLLDGESVKSCTVLAVQAGGGEGPRI